MASIRRFTLLPLVLCASLFQLDARASLVLHDLFLTVETVTQQNPVDPNLSGKSSFGTIQVGEVWGGFFSVDDSELAVDGINSTAEAVNFSLTFGKARYSTSADNLTLAGFRNGLSLGAAGPGLVIENSSITDLLGGVYGLSDVPFIDFSGLAVPTGHFAAYDGFTRVTGTLGVFRLDPHPAPEPGSLALLALAMAAAAAAGLRAQRSDIGHPSSLT